MDDESSVSGSESSTSSSSSSLSSSSSSSSRSSKAKEEVSTQPGEGQISDKFGEKTTLIADGAPAKKKKDFWAQKCAVYMKGFPFRASDTEISNFLSDLSNMKSFNREKNADGQWSGAIVVKFAGKEGVEQALKLNKSVWGGTGADGQRYIHVEEHDAKKQKKRNNNKAKGGKSNIENTIFLGGLPSDVKENELKALIHSHLDTRCFKLRLAYDPDKSMCRGFGHVEFDNVSDKIKALKLQLSLQRPGEAGGTRLKIRNPSTPEKRKELENKRKKKQKKLAREQAKEKRRKDMIKKTPEGFKGKLLTGSPGGESLGRKRGGAKHRDKSKRQRTD